LLCRNEYCRRRSIVGKTEQKKYGGRGIIKKGIIRKVLQKAYSRRGITEEVPQERHYKWSITGKKCRVIYNSRVTAAATSGAAAAYIGSIGSIGSIIIIVYNSIVIAV
jgi:hypothetical protein